MILIQLSDLHLGRSFGGLDLAEDVRRDLHEASIDAVRRAVDLASERGATAILVAGDLFDRPDVDPDLYEPVREHFAATGVPVLVSPGNHDEFGRTSVWNRRTLEHLGLQPWSPNVHVFETRTLTPHAVGDGELIVYGHRVEGYHTHEDSPLASFERQDGGSRHVLLIHGALASEIHDHRTTFPFSAPQLAAAGVHYVAAGHYHGFRVIEHEGRTLGAYAGIPVPGAIDEDPHGGVLVVGLEETGPVIERVETYAGRIRRISVPGEPPFESTEDAVERITRQAALDEAGPADIVLVDLCGASSEQIDLAVVDEALRDSFLALRVRDGTEPAGLDAGRGEGGRVTVASQFEADMRDRIESCSDPDRRRRFEEALRYGRLALRGRSVKPPAVLAMDETEQEAAHAS